MTIGTTNIPVDEQIERIERALFGRPISSDIRPRRTYDKSGELPYDHVQACFEIRQYEKIRRCGV